MCPTEGDKESGRFTRTSQAKNRAKVLTQLGEAVWGILDNDSAPEILWFAKTPADSEINNIACLSNSVRRSTMPPTHPNNFYGSTANATKNPPSWRQYNTAPPFRNSSDFRSIQVSVSFSRCPNRGFWYPLFRFCAAAGERVERVRRQLRFAGKSSGGDICDAKC